MRTLLSLCLLLLAFSVQAQLVTNIELRVRINIEGVGGSTNSTTQNVLSSANKDKARIDALAWTYQKQVAGGETNEWSNWAAKTWLKDKLDDLVRDKADADYRQLAEDVSSVLKKNPEDLTAQELSTLETIAAKKQ